jgi:hypothetical protein
MRRVAVLFETQWDRRQLAACGAGTGLDLSFPEPSDADCRADFDPEAFIGAAAAGALGRLDGVMSSSDYPGAPLAAAIATRLGLPGSRPERVIGASHKYYSRRVQSAAAPEAVPRFALVDPRRPDAPPPLPFPCFVKPVKGAFSVLARRVDDARALREFLGSSAVRDFCDEYMAVFNRLVAALTTHDIDGHWFIAEELLHGDLVTVEGFVCEGRVELLGIVDSTLHANRSFARFDYPSRLPPGVQARMEDVAKRVISALGLDWTLFNIEMIWDAARDRVAIIEVNPRMCGQFGDLYQKVDGTSGYQVALALCTGDRPRVSRGGGRFAAAASFPLRVFEPVVVARAPSPADVAAAEALFPDTLVWSELAGGETLADFSREDGTSHRCAVVNVGGADRDDLARRCAAVAERLGFHMRPLRAHA